MAKRIKISKSKNSESFSIIDDYTHPQTKKRSSYVVESLGSLSDLKKKYNTDSRDVVWQHLTEYCDILRLQDKLEKSLIPIMLSPNRLIAPNDERLYNIGYLYPRNILSSLGLKKICTQIQSQRQFKFDLFKIISDLVSTRIIYPGSKRSSYKEAHHFLETPQYSLDDVYRSLPILADERYFIESELYKNSDSLYKRDNTILFYDCTNFYFEIEEEFDMCMYGKSKENRANPIVQYGLFMDAKGVPIADYVYDGNKNEQFSLRTLEERIEKDFQFSKFIVCADAGLNGWDNKIYNDKKKQGAFIVTQPIKKLEKNLREWTISSDGWKIQGHNGTYDISNLEETIEIDGRTFKTHDIIFYKDRWKKTTKKDKKTNQPYTLEEHLIITFSTKYKKYQNHIREKKLERARKMLNKPGKLGTSNPRDPKYYITKINTTKDGEVAKEIYYSINEEKVLEDQKYDGFYGVVTNLEDDNLSEVIKANRRRWEIEESFEIMKSELMTRPMYVTKEQAVKGHLLICFIALLVYRILEKEYIHEKYTCDEIISTLRKLNITHIGGNNYIPSFKRTEIVDDLAEIFGFQPSRELLTQKYLKKFTRVVNSKKSTKMK